MRRARLETRPLREVSPGATLVTVDLSFDPAAEQAHAEQRFALYPAARAFFLYPCPFGDCDGIFDLSAIAGRTLERTKPRIAGSLECTGARPRAHQERQQCGLRAKYVISAQHES